MSALWGFWDWDAIWPAFLEIVVLFAVLYGILRFLQGTRGAGLLRGLLFALIMGSIVLLFFVRRLPVYRLQFLIQPLGVVLLPIIILFQPEIRRFLLRLGEAPVMRLLLRSEAPVVVGIVDAAFALSKRKIGALIAVERDIGLGEYIEHGTLLNAKVTSELLITIFWPGSPLHDGAVVIRGHRVAAARCLFPLTDQPGVTRSLGTRHRAGIGITEHSDALAIVVSEESRQVSVAYRGKLRMGLNREQLRRVLEETLTETVSHAVEEGGE